MILICVTSFGMRFIYRSTGKTELGDVHTFADSRCVPVALPVKRLGCVPSKHIFECPLVVILFCNKLSDYGIAGGGGGVLWGRYFNL
jgi:hypothetical protein